MMMSTKGRYAVMAMVDMVQLDHKENGSGPQPVTLADISTRQEIPLSYLEQIFSLLRKAGLVKSVRGPGGGYLLARSAQDTNVSDIVMAVDESLQMTRCGGNHAGGCMSDKTRCITHDLWEGLENQIYGYLRSISLEDVVSRQVLQKSMMFRLPAENKPGSELV